jgi:hypothetical protein
MNKPEIKPVTMYPCPLTGKLFKSKTAAAKNAEKEQAKLDAAKEQLRLNELQKEKEKEMVDYIRLNLKDVNDLRAMLIEKAKEFYGITITELSISVSFGNVSNSHGCPLDGVENWSNTHKDRPTSYLGWSGNIHMKAEKANAGTSISDGIGNTLFNRWGGRGFRGFHTGSGCGGQFNDYAMDIGFYFFLSDFPLLAAKHQEFLKEKEKFLENRKNVASAHRAGEEVAEKDAAVQDLDSQIAALNKQMNELQQKRNNAFAVAKDAYLQSNPPTIHELSKDWDLFLKQFANGYWGNSWLRDED